MLGVLVLVDELHTGQVITVPLTVETYFRFSHSCIPSLVLIYAT